MLKVKISLYRTPNQSESNNRFPQIWRRTTPPTVDLAVKMLFHDGLRFAVTLTGLGFAVLLALFTAGLVLGLLDRGSSVIEMLGADLWVTSRNIGVVDFPVNFPETRLTAVRSVAGVARADNLLVDVGVVKTTTGSVEPITVYAVESFANWHLPLVEGRVRDLEELEGIALDGSMMSHRRIGAFRVGDYREIDGRRLKILGETLGPSTFTTSPLAFMEFGLLQSIMPHGPGQTSYIIVKLLPGADAGAVAAEIKRRLPLNEVFTSAQWVRNTRHYWLYRTGLGLNLGIDVMMAFIVGIVVVAQSVYVSTTEHLKEFGMIKAIGGSDWDIYRILLRHAYIYALASFLVGYLGVLIVDPILRSADDMGVVLNPELLFGTLVVFAVMSVAAAMLSFRKVAELDPARVFRG